MIKDNDYNIYRDNEGNEYNKISLFEAIQQSWSDIGTNGGILGGGGDPGSINLDTGAYNNASLGKLTVDKLLSIFKGAKRDYVGACLAVLSKYGTKVGLTDKAKLLVLAQFAHESGGFRYTAELGKGKGRKYGLPTGPYNQVYYGRGPIQITWDYNYKAITQKYFPQIGLNADIYANPNLCETNIEIGCAASLCWFLMPGNGKRAVQCANSGDVRGLSKAINGGWNGLAERESFTEKILKLASQA